MREIKFRAWVKPEKKMYWVSSIHLTSDAINDIYVWLRVYENEMVVPTVGINKNSIELMQYT
jgi:hypothetical protein